MKVESDSPWFGELAPVSSLKDQSTPPPTIVTRGSRVCIESPFAGDVALHVRYADALMLDALERGEYPFMGHLLYPRVLDDTVFTDRELGIAAHIAFIGCCDLLVVALDLGEPTPGMLKAITRAEQLGVRVVPRFLGRSWERRYIARPTAGTRWR